MKNLFGGLCLGVIGTSLLAIHLHEKRIKNEKTLTVRDSPERTWLKEFAGSRDQKGLQWLYGVATDTEIIVLYTIVSKYINEGIPLPDYLSIALANIARKYGIKSISINYN